MDPDRSQEDNDVSGIGPSHAVREEKMMFEGSSNFKVKLPKR